MVALTRDSKRKTFKKAGASKKVLKTQLEVRKRKGKSTTKKGISKAPLITIVMEGIQ